MDFAKVNIIGYETVAEDKAIKGNVNVCGKNSGRYGTKFTDVRIQSEKKSRAQGKKKSMSNESEKMEKQTEPR